MGSSEHRIVSRLGEVLDDRGMTLTELSQITGLTMANLSVLKNGRAKAVRFSSLTLICDALDCSPADVLDIKHKT
jgi:putative transcriptional regulator